MPWFEEFEIGAHRELGDYTFTKEEIVRFAEKYDPQPIHIDPEAARLGPYGGLVASGWHVVAIYMKQVTRMQAASLKSRKDEGAPTEGPSPGFLEMKWLHPVRPGDRIRYRATVKEKINLASRPDWGIMRSFNEAVNQNGELVLSFVSQVLVMKRQPGK